MSELDKAAEAAKAVEDISFMEAGAGFEGMGADQFSPMYLRILHSDAKQIQEGMPEYVPGAKFGDFFNDLSGKAYGKTIDVVPLKSDILWFEYHPTKIGDFKGVHAPYSIPTYGDEYKGLYVAEGEGKGNRIVITHVFYVLVVGEFEKGIGILSFHKSGIPHAKIWNTRIRQTLLPDGKQAPYFSSVWRLTSAMNSNDQGTWYTIGKDKTTYAERLRWVSKDDYSNVVKPSRVQVDSSKGAMQAAIAAGEAQAQLTADAGKGESEF